MNNKIISFLLAFLVMTGLIIQDQITERNLVYAQEKIIKTIESDKNEIRQGESFGVKVSFGGQGSKITPGQTEEINFNLQNTKIQLPTSPIILRDKNGNEMGKVEFFDNRAKLSFNDYAATLDDVEGAFNFNVFAHWTQDPNTPGEGSVEINNGSIRKNIKFIYETGGIATDNIYSKKGVWRNLDPQGNRLDWVFSFNAALKATNENDVDFNLADKLDQSMEWDTTANSTNPYVVKIGESWYTLDQARQFGITIDFQGQNLTINIPRYILLNGTWQRPLDRREISIRLTAKVRDEVMLNPDIKEVSNTSDARVNGIDWEIKPEDNTDSVLIIRSGGWAYGTKPGELKIVKVLKDKKIPIKDVEFLLERKDGQDIVIKESGSNVNKGKQIKLITNEQGAANIRGLSTGDYLLSESKAPEWIEFKANQPITKEFQIKNDDLSGKELTIENSKKTINIKAEKIWKNLSQVAPDENIKIQLYRNSQPFMDAVTLSPSKLSHTWENLDLADDKGSIYNFEVRELDENGQALQNRSSFKIKQKSYKVAYSGNLTGGFTITNTEETPWVPMIPATINIKVSKEWKDSQEKNMNAPVEEIEVELYKNEQATGNKIKLNASNNWSAEFKNLEVSPDMSSPDNYRYTIKEVGEISSLIKFSNKNYKVNYRGDMKIGFTITNTEEIPPEEPDKPVPNEPEKPVPNEPEKPVPNEPEKPVPNKPEKPVPNEPEKPAPKTSDDFSLGYHVPALILTSIALATILVKNKRIYR
ncbi:Cna B-type domain-containing protein [Peptoniphilaceae bacterium SGI.131]